MFTRGSGILRRLPPLLLTLVFSGLLLAAWIRAASAQNYQPNGYIEEQSRPALDNYSFSPQSLESHPFPDAHPSERQSALSAPFGLKIVKSWVPIIFNIGSSNNHYIINVSRSMTGTMDSPPIVEDDLPAGLTWTPPAPGKWDCSASTSTHVSCSYNDTILPTQLVFEPIKIDVNVPGTVTGDFITNTAKLFYGGSISPTDVFTAVTPVRSADLLVRKTQIHDSEPPPTTTITYTISVKNTGPDTANNVYIIETLSPDLNPISSYTITGGGTFSTTTGRWDLPTITAGSTQTLTIRIKPKPTAGGRRIDNTAKVYSSTYDPNPSNNTASTSFVIGEVSKLVIAKIAPSDDKFVGEPFDFTIVITNTSNTQVYANVKDTISPKLDVIDCNVSTGLGSGKCFVYNQLLNTYVTIPGNTAATVNIKARGNQEVTSRTTVTNTASVSWGSSGTILKSNEASLDILPGGYAQIGKKNSFSSLYPGQVFTYSVGLTNTGSVPLQIGSIVITDTLISNLEFVSINKNGLTMNELVQTPNVRSWSFPNTALNAGDKLEFFITARVKKGAIGQAINQAEGSGKDIFNRTTKSTFTDSDNIIDTSQANISILKSVTPVQAKVGETFTFKIVLDNTGGQPVNAIRVNDYFPDVLDLTSATTSRGTAVLNTTDREVEVNIPVMNAGEKTTIVILAKVNATVKSPKTYRNRAYIKWTGRSEYASNNVQFRVLTSGTLPGTGVFGLAAGSSAAFWLIGASGFLLILAALILFAMAFWARGRHPLNVSKYARLGIVLALLGACLGSFSIFLASRTKPSQELLALEGEKPPISSALPTQPVSAKPTKSRHPILSSDTPEAPFTEEVTEAVQLLDVRPSPDPSHLALDSAYSLPTLTSGEVDISHLLPTPTPSTLPDYPVPTPTALVSVGPDGGTPDSSSVKRMTIPAIGVDAVVKYVPFNGSTWLIGGLKHEIAWMGDTSWPGLGGNTGFAGHVDLATGERGPFWDLKNLKNGDQVIVFTSNKVYTYRVNDRKVVEDTDMSVIAPSTKPQITLITCTGWNIDLHLYVQRLAVFAELLNVTPLTTLAN